MTASRLLFLLILLIPSPVLAALQITEIMYDLPGSDAGREWVEVINTGSSSADLSAYKFFNKDGGHLLKAYGSGATTLAAGGVAVIADKPDLFLTDNPGYTGMLIDSSFSLVSSDTVGMKDADNTIIDSIAYASSMGANGDGNTLQRSGSSLVAAAPTPGYVAQSGGGQAPTTGGSDTNPASSTPGTAGTQLSDSSAVATVPLRHTKTISVDGGGDRTLVAGADALFTAKAYGTMGEPLPNAQLTWNFGNGESREGQTVFFAYPYPGKYVLSLVAVSGEYTAEDRILIEVNPAEVGLVLETDGSLSVFNKSKRDLDISLWRLTEGGQTFYIPKNTIVLANSNIRFATSTTKFSGGGAPGLMYPNGTNALAGPGSLALNAPPAPVTDSAMRKTAGRSSSVTTAFNQPAAAVESLSGQGDSKTKDDRWMLWLAAALGIATVGVAGVVLLRHGIPANTQSISEADREAEKYEIIE